MTLPWSFTKAPYRAALFGDGLLELKLDGIAMHDRNFTILLLGGLYVVVDVLLKNGNWLYAAGGMVVLLIMFTLSKRILVEMMHIRFGRRAFIRNDLRHTHIDTSLLKKDRRYDEVRMDDYIRHCHRLCEDTVELNNEACRLADGLKVPSTIRLARAHREMLDYLASPAVTSWVLRLKAHQAQVQSAEREWLRIVA